MISAIAPKNLRSSLNLIGTGFASVATRYLLKKWRDIHFTAAG
jgi:aryl carrier-like protein